MRVVDLFRVYLNHIFIFFKSEERHVIEVNKVVIIRQADLCMKRKKCAFEHTKVHLIRHVDSAEVISDVIDKSRGSSMRLCLNRETDLRSVPGLWS